jgi:hypothetical protein
MKHIKLFEILIQSTNDLEKLHQRNKDHFLNLKFKLNDIVMLTDEYFIKKKKHNDLWSPEFPIDSDDILDRNEIYKIMYIDILGKYDNDTYYIINDSGSEWVKEDDIEICPEWMIDAQKYNL